MGRTWAWLGAGLLCLGSGCEQLKNLKGSNADESDWPRVDPNTPVVDPTDLTPAGDGVGPSITVRPAPVLAPTDAATDAATDDTPIECASTETRCDDTCVDTQTTSGHCGECHHACASDQLCVAGACACTGTKILCGGKCKEPQVGPCGSCGELCTKPPDCDDGSTHQTDWPTLGADMLRSGYNAGEKGVPPLTEGWTATLLNTQLNPAMVYGSRVFVSADASFKQTGPVYALDLETGEPQWTKDFGDVSSVGMPTLANCKVFIQSAKGDLPSKLWAFHANDGAELWKQDFPSQWGHYWSPTLSADAVFVDAGSFEGLYGYAQADGALRWENLDLGQYDSWSAAYYGGDVYSFVGGTLRRHDAKTGTTKDSFYVTWNGSWSMNTSPVFSSDGTVYLVASPQVYAFNATTKQPLWMGGTNVSGMPALAEGLLLAFDNQQLVAFDAKTGEKQWTALDTAGLWHPPVVANGFAYAASTGTTYAVDLKTGDVVWHVDVGGWLSIGGGRLFVAGADGVLRTYRLSAAAGN
ncbi:MAG: PQQ-binding-like beta-propeller repeat protein [Myxococcales bacterium]